MPPNSTPSGPNSYSIVKKVFDTIVSSFCSRETKRRKRTITEARTTWEFQCIDVSNSGMPKIIALFYVNGTDNGVNVYTVITGLLLCN